MTKTMRSPAPARALILLGNYALPCPAPEGMLVSDGLWRCGGGAARHSRRTYSPEREAVLIVESELADRRGGLGIRESSVES